MDTAWQRSMGTQQTGRERGSRIERERIGVCISCWQQSGLQFFSASKAFSASHLCQRLFGVWPLSRSCSWPASGKHAPLHYPIHLSMLFKSMFSGARISCQVILDDRVTLKPRGGTFNITSMLASGVDTIFNPVPLLFHYFSPMKSLLTTGHGHY